MFFTKQKIDSIEYYQRMLKTIGSLSGLFSNSNQPYIAPRIAENLFCTSFAAENLSRKDCSADASKNKLGIGIKTFVDKNGLSMQKVAEFNSEHKTFAGLKTEAKIKRISEMRNSRIETTKRIYNLDDIIYHCVIRNTGVVNIFECPMDLILLSKIKDIKEKSNVIYFKDSLNEYSFNIAKSTLYKRFIVKNSLLEVKVKVLDNPFDSLEKLFLKTLKEIKFAPIKKEEHLFLPLYSFIGGEKKVPEKSALNQWNAGGRPRNPNEVYIPIPSWIHKTFKSFFPDREKPFDLILPNNSTMSVKLCQDGSKALMSKHNADLGKWLLRDVLNLRECELLTYKKLEEIGIDSVVIYKNKNGKYDIDFTKIDSYENFKNNNKNRLNDDD